MSECVYVKRESLSVRACVSERALVFVSHVQMSIQSSNKKRTVTYARARA